LIIPTAAVRDEGTSYHYIAPAREITADKHALAVIEDTMIEQKVPYLKAKTWTTDAIYRETPQKIQTRKNEGYLTVEMEAAAYMAVSQYNKVIFGQILYAGDTLDSKKWDKRNFTTKTKIRESLLKLALDTCLKL